MWKYGLCYLVKLRWHFPSVQEFYSDHLVGVIPSNSPWRTPLVLWYLYPRCSHQRRTKVSRFLPKCLLELLSVAWAHLSHRTACREVLGRKVRPPYLFPWPDWTWGKTCGELARCYTTGMSGKRLGESTGSQWQSRQLFPASKWTINWIPLSFALLLGFFLLCKALEAGAAARQPSSIPDLAGNI